MKLSIVAALSLALSGCVVAIDDGSPEYDYTEETKRIFVKDGIITKLISSTNFNYVFYVEVEGGTGECADKRIGFKRVGHIALGEKSFEMAKIAYLEKKTVTISNNGTGNGCSDASFIEITD
jgi:hypothetical protein